MKKYASLIGIIIFVAVPLLALAQTKISVAIPGSNPITASSPPGYVIANLYQFAILIGGVAAFGAVVYGGVRYVTSAGNPSSQSDAKEWIYSAFLGLALLICAYLILNTINPNLIHLDLPTSQGTSITSGGAGGGGGGGTSGGGTGCAGGGTCGTLPNCMPSAKVNCGGAAEMVNTMNCISQKDPSYNVSEGYPPTGGHSSSCHNTGCCIDTTVSGGNCAAASALISAAQQCGASALNEYTNCGGKSYVNTTAGNIHITAPHMNGC